MAYFAEDSFIEDEPYVEMLPEYDITSQLGDAINCEACFGIIANAATLPADGTTAIPQNHLDHYVAHISMSTYSSRKAQATIEAAVRSYLNS